MENLVSPPQSASSETPKLLATVTPSSKFLAALTTIFISLFMYPQLIHANMVTSPQQTVFLVGYSLIGFIFLLFVIPLFNSYIEAYIAGLILGNNYPNKNLLMRFRQINFISYYPAFALLLILQSEKLSLVIVELFVVSFEFFLIKWKFPFKMSPIQIFKVSLLGNAASFVLGNIILKAFQVILTLYV